jgi:hypothetical protein
MGYSYGYNPRPRTGKYNLLSCDGCGLTTADGATAVRKRTCTFKVPFRDYLGNLALLPYCPPPALCADCFAKHGKGKGIHGRCAEGAADSTARFHEDEASYAAGDSKVFTAYGDWKDEVPSGYCLVGFKDKDGNETYRLIATDDYHGGCWLSAHPDAPVAARTF